MVADEQNGAAAGGAEARGNDVSMRLIDQAEATARDTFAALRAAAQAQDLSEVMRIQGDFLREQTNRSLQHAREMGELILQYGRNAVTPGKGSEK